MVSPQAFCTCEITSGFKGSPALANSRRLTLISFNGNWMIERQTVGGAQNEVPSHRANSRTRLAASKRAWFTITMAASAFHGAKKELHACLAHPGLLKLRCLSPGRRPSQYIVDRCPMG